MDSIDYFIIFYAMSSTFGLGFLFWITKTKSDGNG